jgi:4-amino-4-deoxy-L-arabinose transferase-like glycosyltransferase
LLSPQGGGLAHDYDNEVAVSLTAGGPVKRTTVLALLGLCVALRFVSLVRPCLSDDEAIYAVVAREMLSGHELYVDIVDHKPPGVYLVYAATQAIGGPVGGMVLLHALLIGVVFGTGLLLARIVRRQWPDVDPRAATAAALLWIVFTTTLVDVDALAANCELFMMLPLVGAVVVFLEARDRLARYVLAGALVGAACLFKYQGGIQLPVLGLAVVLRHSERSIGRRLAVLIALGAGFLAMLAAAAGTMWLRGGLPDAVFWLKFNFAYIDAGTSAGELVGRLVTRGGLVVASAAVLYGFGAAAIATGHRQPFVRFMAGWLVASAIAVFMGGRFFGHYFHQLTAPLAILAAPATVRLWERRRGLAVLAIGVPAFAYAALGGLHDQLMQWYGEPDPDYASVVAWLDHRGSGALCVWGNSPVLYFEAERPLGCRFVFSNYLTGLSPATATQSDPTVDSSRNVVAASWPMLERDLAERQPRFIVDGSVGDVGRYGKYPPAKFPRLQRALDCGYVPRADVAGMRIYERRTTPRCEPASVAAP